MELFIVNGICGGTVFHLPDVPTVLGRSPESHVQIGDPWISSMHALFERRGDELWVVDLDSRNGTFVEEERVHEARIAPGMKLRFGKTGVELRVRSAGSQDEATILSDQRTVLRYISDVVGEPAPTVPGAGRASAPLNSAARRQAAVLNEIGRALLEARELAPSLDRVLRILAAAVRAERSSVLLMDGRGELVPCVSVPGDRPPARSQTLLTATLRSRAGILTLNAQQDARFAQSPSVVTQGIQSCISAPIWTDNRMLGVLVLERGFVHPFSAEDLELATVVGFQAALAVERVRLAERDRASEETRQHLLRVLGPAARPLLGGDPADRDRLSAAAREVGVVAAAIDGVDALAAAAPPQEAGRRLLALQRALAEVALAAGAAVDLRLDGGLLAVLDPVQPAPDLAARAQRCAAALVARAAALEGEQASPRLAVRAGVACGRALVGNLADAERPELRAAGAAVDAALRRASRAAPGQLCDSDPA